MSTHKYPPAKYLCLAVEHYSNREIIEAARSVLGGIDLDPASCAEANREVRASCYYTKEVDGLALPWFGRVWLNPPGGTLVVTDQDRARLPADEFAALKARYARERDRWGIRSRSAAWWRKLTEEYQAGRVTRAVFLGFNIEILRSGQPRAGAGGAWPSPLAFPICIPAKRLRFQGSQPPHASAIVYLGPDVDAFAREFSHFGDVQIPASLALAN